MTLKELPIGSTALITSLKGEGALRQHFLDMGMLPGAEVTVIKYAPMGDPMELRIQGYELTLRMADAEKVNVFLKKNSVFKKTAPAAISGHMYYSGQGGGKIFHKGQNELPLPEGTVLTFALAGNQNCGKTTLFNCLTGSNQHVGNFPGVTVDKKSGPIKGHPNTLVTDLPGIYSLSPYTGEEIVSRKFILNQKPTGIINIADATNIQRNLYLTLQLIELDMPVILALNMMDEMRGNGGSVKINKMQEMLGIPVVPISASKNEGVDELIGHAIRIAQYKEKPARTDFCRSDKNGSAVRRCLHSIMCLIEDHAGQAKIPLKFAACKLVEGDRSVLNALNLSKSESEMLERIILEMEQERGLDRAAAIADMRFGFIKELCANTVVNPKISKEYIRSKKIDEFLTGKYTAIPAFAAIMGLVFWLTFHVIGTFLQGLLEQGINIVTSAVDSFLTASNVNPTLHSLIIDGIFNGVGSVLSFVPVIVVLFFFLSMLEDSGYMARVAFVTDRLLRKIGLSGRSIVPMLIGFGCTVPGVMASRTLPSERDRKMTIMLTPFMSCTAKLPIYTFFSSAFFPKYSGLVMFGLYFFGILSGITVAVVLKNTAFKGEAIPFVMELPNYRMPGAKNVLRLLWDKAKDFLQRAFTLIFLACIIIWFLQSFDFGLNAVSDSQNSILAVLAGCIAPVFDFLGFGDWRIVTALIAGFIAKESVVSTLSVLLGGAATLVSAVTPLSALSLLVFCLLYTPCIAAIAAIRRELGGKWAAGILIGQCVIAWICAMLVRAVGILTMII